jgi:Dolichyl-phosphate-mannose-protein mannosyltransferase/PA14 domain
VTLRPPPILFPRTLLTLVLLSGLLVALPWIGGTGLVGRYYAFAIYDDPPRLVSFDDRLLAEDVDRRAGRFLYHRFGVIWTGYLRVPEAGRYDFRLDASGRATLTIGPWLRLESQTAPGTVTTGLLPAGLVPIRIEYQRTFGADGGPLPARCDLLWGRGGQLRSLVAPDNVPTRVAGRLAPSLAGIAASVREHFWLWLPLFWTLVLLAHLAWWMFRPIARHLARLSAEPQERRLLLATLGAGALMVLVGLWWGLPAGWAIDEVWPSSVSDGTRRWFSGGWFFWYPPLHYYVLALLSAPFEICNRLGFTDFQNVWVYGSLFAVNRIVTALLAVATLFVVYLCGLEIHGRRLWAIGGAMLVVVMPTFAYYGKLANLDLPYVFWVMCACLWYLRAVKRLEPRAYYLFALTSALAVTTKDQAYGFFVLPVLHLAILALVPRREPVVPIGRRLAMLAVTALVGIGTFLLAHNVLFNDAGFIKHFELITGPGGTNFRMWDRSLAGQAAMLTAAIRWLGWAMGWPSFIASVTGLAWLLRRTPHMALALILPAASYYLFFIGYIMYHHDRFFLGVTMMLAVAGGVVVGALLSSERTTWVRGATVCVLALLAYRAFSLDLLMLGDSRYEVERWLQRRAGGGSKEVCFSGPAEFLPRPFGLRACDLAPDWEELRKRQPDLVVINAEFSRRDWNGRPPGEFYRRLRSGQDGYELALRYKSPAGLAWLGHEEVFADRREHSITNLDKVNPEIEVYRKVPPR